MKIFLLFSYFLCVFSLEGVEDSVRQKRSDDVLPLIAVVNQLSSKVDALQTKLLADEAKLAAQQAEIALLKAKNCYTGQIYLRPNDEQETITGTGLHEKTQRKHVTFSQPFTSIPRVEVSLRYIDSTMINLRVDVGYSAVTQTGFDVYAHTWIDTKLIMVGLTWIACSG